MPVQDDARENQMINLFNLVVPEGLGRSDIDARLPIDGLLIDFELKSTTGQSVSTVRDFGPDHIKRWRDGLHWLFAFYDKRGEKLLYCIYASPADMEPWIASKERYIASDMLLAERLPEKVTKDTVVELLGEHDCYTLVQARSIMKQQWSTEQYIAFQDIPSGYSLQAMVEILQMRARYIILRGSTLNNPHIERGFFDGFDRITEEHASVLRQKVRDYLASVKAMDSATE